LKIETRKRGRNGEEDCIYKNKTENQQKQHWYLLTKSSVQCQPEINDSKISTTTKNVEEEKRK